MIPSLNIKHAQIIDPVDALAFQFISFLGQMVYSSLDLQARS